MGGGRELGRRRVGVTSSHGQPVGERAWVVSELCLWGQGRQLWLREGLAGRGLLYKQQFPLQ